MRVGPILRSEWTTKKWSGRPDSNRRPPAPKRPRPTSFGRLFEYVVLFVIAPRTVRRAGLCERLAIRRQHSCFARDVRTRLLFLCREKNQRLAFPLHGGRKLAALPYRLES